MNKQEALLIVDAQNDFCPGGALAVPEGDRVVSVLNQYIEHFHPSSPQNFHLGAPPDLGHAVKMDEPGEAKDKSTLAKTGHAQNKPIFASRDWHPLKTTHFKEYGGPWPIHCVQNTSGAQFHPDLKLPQETIILSKGMDPKKDSYSAFQGLDSQGTPFLDILRKEKIKILYVGGLATDYCVKSSVLDARKLGFDVYLLMDAIRAVNLKLEDSQRAVDEMISAGAKQMTVKGVK